MGNKNLREFLEEPLDNSWINEMAMTLQDIAKSENISHTMVRKILKKAVGKVYYAIAKDEEYADMDAFEKMVVLIKMIEELGGNDIDVEKILDYLPKDIAKDVREAGKEHMRG